MTEMSRPGLITDRVETDLTIRGAYACADGARMRTLPKADSRIALDSRNLTKKQDDECADVDLSVIVAFLAFV